MPDGMRYQKVPGGEYTAEKQSDGTWTIFGVPIFSVNKRKLGSKIIEFGKEWLQNALAKAKVRLEQDQYTPPLHKKHHNTGEKVEQVGHFIPQAVKDFTFDGKTVPTMFADLIGISKDDMEDIKQGKLPYRSIEILDPDQEEIDSLALLDTKVPFFRYPNLTLKHVFESKYPDTAMAFQDDKTKAVSILLNYGDDKMPKDKAADEKVENEVDKHEDGEGEKFAEGEEKGDKVTNAPTVDDDADNKNIKMEEGVDSGMVLNLLTQIAAKLGIGVEQEDNLDDNDNTLSDQDDISPVQAEANKEKIVKMTAEEAKSAGKFQAQIAKLTKTVTKLDNNANQKKRIEDAHEVLACYGIEKVTLLKYAASDETMKNFVEGVMQVGTPDPPQFMGEKQSEIPEEVMEYQGDELKCAEAMKFSRLYDSLPEHQRNGEKKTFIENNMFTTFGR